jgi:hypothetical protein
MRVQIIETDNMYDLEYYINEILSKHHPSEIVDIKYTGSGNRAPYSHDYYSAMIIFQEADDHV